MTYYSPAVRLLQGIETALRAMTDDAGNRLLQGAEITPVEIPMECGRPYALIQLGLQTNEHGDVSTTAYVVLYLEATLTREGLLEAQELAWQIQGQLSEELHRGELADGVYEGSTKQTDFYLKATSADGKAEPTPECYVIIIEIQPQWLDD